MFSRRLFPLSCVLLAAACFEDPASSGETGSSSTDTGAASETSTGSTDSTSDSTDTGSETAGCTDLGCPCTDAGDCNEDLTCVEGECAAAGVCGDGAVESQEQCDDGNAQDGDGCDNDCTYTEILAVDAGGAHTCALIEGGRVKCWGLNTFGQLGLGNVLTIGDDELPSDVGDVELPGPAVQISGGLAEHSCALLEDGSVYCWGRNNAGQLGLGHTDDIGDDEGIGAATDVGVEVEEVEVGSFQTCARGTDQTVYCWGLGFYGQLGYGNVDSIGDDEAPSDAGPVPVGGPIKEIAVGGSHTCALALIGTVYCWGYNEFGELGYGNTDNIGDDELPSDVFAIDLPSPIVHLTAGGFHVCALLESGEAYCWGRSEFGQTGHGTTDNVGDDEAPTGGGPLDVGAPIRLIDGGFFHTCAVNELNELRCWGNNDAGQLGQGNTLTLGDNEAIADIPPVSLL